MRYTRNVKETENGFLGRPFFLVGTYDPPRAVPD